MSFLKLFKRKEIDNETNNNSSSTTTSGSHLQTNTNVSSPPMATISEPKHNVEQLSTNIMADDRLSFSTLAICSDRKVEKVSDLAPPLHLSTTFSLDSDVSDGNIYSRVHNKTRSRLETLVANLEGSDEYKSVAFASGQAATFTLLFTLKPKRIFKRMKPHDEEFGKKFNQDDDAVGYSGTSDAMSLLRLFAKHYCGILKRQVKKTFDETTDTKPSKETLDEMENENYLLQLHDLEDIEKEPLDEKKSGLYLGDVIWLETPVNPTCDLEDIEYYSNKAKQMGALLVVDSTFASPALQQPLKWGADFALHSATKFMGGHSDLLGGMITGKSNGLINSVKSNRSVMGGVMGNLEAYLLMRSLRTLNVRVNYQSQSAEIVANWLQSQIGNDETKCKIVKVHYPTLHRSQDSTHPNSATPLSTIVESSSQQEESIIDSSSTTATTATTTNKKLTNYEICQKQMNGKGPGILSFELTNPEEARRLPKFLNIIENATSLGGVESSIDYRFQWDNFSPPSLLRLSIGLESPKDLITDLKNALLKI